MSRSKVGVLWGYRSALPLSPSLSIQFLSLSLSLCLLQSKCPLYCTSNAFSMSMNVQPNGCYLGFSLSTFNFLSVSSLCLCPLSVDGKYLRSLPAYPMLVQYCDLKTLLKLFDIGHLMFYNKSAELWSSRTAGAAYTRCLSLALNKTFITIW
jgi:hypothetical protein